MSTDTPGLGPMDPARPLAAPQPGPYQFGPPAWTLPPNPTPAPPRRRERRGLGVFATVLIAAMTAAIVGAFAGLAGYVVGRSVDQGVPVASAASAPVTLPQSNEPVVREPGSINSIVSAVMPSVVSIQVDGSSESGSGSGFVLRPDGFILTNNHVVDLAASGGELTVVFSDGQKSAGTIVGRNPEYDLAVVKVDRSDLAPLTLGNSDDVLVGDLVVAIGAPLGLDGTVTSGIVSAKDRPVTAGGADDMAYINAIQTDAAINPGNSGGPLLDAGGRVIGINSAIATLAFGGEAGNIGLGFAIPSNSAKRIAEELITTGDSSTPIIGVSLDLAYEGEGARVSEVNSGGPSQKAGLKPGDIITRLDDRSIDDSTELVVAIRSYAPGDKVTLEVERAGKVSTFDVTLGSASGNR
jgi:putative serine protease PepD